MVQADAVLQRERKQQGWRNPVSQAQLMVILSWLLAMLAMQGKRYCVLDLEVGCV